MTRLVEYVVVHNLMDNDLFSRKFRWLVLPFIRLLFRVFFRKLIKCIHCVVNSQSDRSNCHKFWTSKCNRSPDLNSLNRVLVILAVTVSSSRQVHSSLCCGVNQFADIY